ncbi:MAG: TrkH family potassium uptake protein, partial [Desulfurococcaceae archaeon]
EMSYMEALASASLTWAALPAISAVPFSLELGVPYVDAFFECVSGFTGTGLTVLIGLERLKPSLLFWRALMQWVGELGFVVIAMVLLPFFYEFGALVYGIERPVRIEASLYKTSRRLFEMYFLLTVAGALALYYAGMGLFDAVVHSMTGIATGGMSNYDANYDAIYRSAPLTALPLAIIMVLGGTNFLVLDRLLRGELGEVARNEEYRLYLALLLFFSSASAVLVAASHPGGFLQGAASGAFNAISALTTTGFSIGSIAQLPYSVKLLLVVAMLIGGMSFSTVGGVKVVRLLLLLKKLKALAVGLVTAGRFRPVIRLGEGVVEESEVASALLIVVIHVFTVLLGAMLIKSMLPGVDFADALFESASAASCVGLSAGITSPTAPLGVKVVLIVEMLLGRLEYLQLLALFGAVAGRRAIKVLK